MNNNSTLQRKNKTAVRFHDGKWEARNGHVVTFSTKNAALLYALSADFPAIGKMARLIAGIHDGQPGVVDRLLRAAQLLTGGHVSGGGDCYHVRSQSSDTVYKAEKIGLPKMWGCTCLDFAKRGCLTDYGPMCKHTLAALLAELTGLDVTPQPVNQALENIKAATSASGIGNDIKRMLGQPVGNATPAKPRYTKEQVDRAYDRAIKPERGKHRPFGAAGRMNGLDF